VALASDGGLHLLNLNGTTEVGPISDVGNFSLLDMNAIAFDPSKARFFFSLNGLPNSENTDIFQYDLNSDAVSSVVARKYLTYLGLDIIFCQTHEQYV